MLLELTAADVDYVRASYRPQTEPERERAAAGVAPEPSYVLPDGTAMTSVRTDEDLADALDPSDLRRRFTERWQAAGGREDELERAIEAYLEGIYGVCLPAPGPEAIVAKGSLADAIEALIARPRPGERWWRETLRATVDAYDALVMPFTSADPARFGRPTSRQSLIDDVRERWELDGAAA